MADISIVTPYYQGAAYIAECVHSVRRQSIANWEHIVVDDGSPDNPAPILSSFQVEDSRFTWTRQGNRGACAARNAGFALCDPRSRYVLFLDQDDCLEPTMIETLVTYLERHPSVGMAFSDRVWIDGAGAVMRDERGVPMVRYAPLRGKVHVLARSEVQTPLVSFLVFNRVNPSCAVLRRSVFEAAGRWDETLAQTGEDTDLWMRMNLRAPAHFVALPLVRRRWHSTSVLRMVNASEQREREAVMLRKWRRGDHLRSEDRPVVESAFTFLDRRFVPWMYVRWGNEAAAHGQFARAARHYVRAGVRRLGISAKP